MGQKSNNKAPLVYIILRNHNAYDFCKISLQSLSNLSYPNYKIILVDDGSNDNSTSQLLTRYPQITLVKTDKYIEYCRSLNLGIEIALQQSAKYIFLVNNDTKDFSKNYLEKIIDTFSKNSHLGIVGSVCYNYQGKTISSGKNKIKFGIPVNIPTEGFVISAEVFHRVGTLNNRLVRYFEDIDLIIRVRKAGLETKSISSISFAHLGGGTSSKQIFIPNYYRVRNLIMFIRHHCQNKPLTIRFTYFHTNFRVHLDRVRIAIKENDFPKTVKIIFSIILGIVVGLFLPWKENNA